jgi:hypothetical protein
MGKLCGEPTTRVMIKVSGADVVAPPDIVWASPEGAEPLTYEFSNTFPNYAGGSEPIPMRFILRCGILTKQPGISSGKERDFGIDVYGNGRLIERYLQDPFGFGTSGLSKRTPATTFVRGKLFVLGHSAAIPWDTHKREYLADHPVSEWLREQVRPVVKAYASAASKFTDEGTTEARKELAATPFDPDTAKPTVKLPVGVGPTNDVLPKLSQPVKSDKARGKEKTKPRGPASGGTTAGNGEGEGSSAELAEGVAEYETVTLDLATAEFTELCSRFQVDTTEGLQEAIRECLLNGVAFSLDAGQMARALKKFRCDEGVAELSEKIRELLLQKL